MKNKLMKKRKNNKGFTLVELLVVIAIIGILAVVAVPALMKNINKAKAADIVSDYSAIKAQVLATYADDSLEDGNYRKAKDDTKLTSVSGSGSSDLDVNDLSTEASYELDVQGNTAKLVIKVENADIAKRVGDDINVKPGADPKKIEIQILK